MIARKLVDSLTAFQVGDKVWVHRGNKWYQGEVMDADPSMGYLVKYRWNDPNHLSRSGKGTSTVIVDASDLAPITVRESMGKSLMPGAVYNCSPSECTPRTDPETFIRNYREEPRVGGWYGYYPVYVIAQEMEYVPSGNGISRGRAGSILDKLGPFDDLASAADAVEQLFRKHQSTRGRVIIYPQGSDVEPHGDNI